MRKNFATQGLPEQLDIYNGPSFTSEEFVQFPQVNGIKHITKALHYPGSIEWAEKAIQTLKKGLRMMTEGSFEHHMTRFLLRLVPHHQS